MRAFLRYKTQNDVRDDNYLLPSFSNLRIFSNYPDPFNNSTIIPFTIPPSGAEFLIVNSLGRTVLKQIIPAGKGGYKTYNWQGTDSNSCTLPSGRYWVLLKNRNGKAVEPVSIVR
ncbi:MAG: T9SS type A sorting domain-containing protein [Candidatus Hatepunaea meridiana]|nr:T9SS type A sorting domain-containing protein [Candidatus Hatepunaea meridiana]